MGADFQDTYSHSPEAFEPFIPLEEPAGAADQLVRKTPWWVISMGLHAAVALIAALFWVADTLAEEVEVSVINPPRKLPEPPVYEKHKTKSPTKLPIKEVADKTIFRRVQQSDHVEQDIDEEFQEMAGDLSNCVSDKPFKGKGIYDTIGGGGGGGGCYPGRGGRLECTMKGGGTPETEDAVLAALRWLARHQSSDGSWGVTAYTGQCSRIGRTGGCSPNPGHADFDAGVTGLSILAFLGGGYSHLSKDTHDGICFGDVVRKGMQWMMSNQDYEGCIGSRQSQKYMYNHTICALAMTEAYGLTGSNLFKDQAQMSLDFTVAAQNPGKGWRYSYKCGDNDSSVTGWAVMVLKSAELSGLSFPISGYQGTRAWYDEVTEKSYGRVGYNAKNTGKVFIPGMNEHYNHHETLTSIAVMARIFMDKTKSDRRISSGVELLLRDKPRWEGNAIDFYYWYYASLALFQYDGPWGPKWRSWNDEMKNALVNNQVRGDAKCKDGCWEPVGRWCCEGGRVYATAINALTLEVYYRYQNVLGVR
jgi:ElaB/YqjD/DUF883 family membrane-anchored ribosome-binding protein